MRTRQRLMGLKAWIQRELCAGKKLKAPDKDMDLGKISRREPACFLGWTPQRPDLTGTAPEDPVNVCPGILIMPNPSRAKFMEEKRFDRYNEIHRPKALGQTLCVSMLFAVYEPGLRLPGFMDKAEQGDIDLSLLREGTEEGMLTLLDWMDECRDKLLGQKSIPGTDLMVDEESIDYALYTDQSYVVDKRPIYYGFINLTFNCYADESRNNAIDKYLE